MNGEIKEILEELENMYEISELEEQVNKINKIRDYITNLQQKKEDYKSRCKKAIEYLDKVEILAMLDGKIIFSINTLRNILQKRKK